MKFKEKDFDKTIDKILLHKPTTQKELKKNKSKKPKPTKKKK